MARRVRGSNGTANVVLPGGWVLDDNDEVVVPDAEWDKILDDIDLADRLDDMGYTADEPTPVPSFRDIQRMVLDGPTGGGGGTGPTPWSATYTFAVASDDWVLPHSKGTKAVHVETFDNSDNPLDGNVLYTDTNTIHVQFYFPQSGYARAWALT